MNEYLVVRLGVEPTDPVNWLVWSQIEQGIIASGTLAGAAELVQLQERAGGRPIIGLAPASELLFREVTLPGRLNRQTIKALPFLLEDVSVTGSVPQGVRSRQGLPSFSLRTRSRIPPLRGLLRGVPNDTRPKGASAGGHIPTQRG